MSKRKPIWIYAVALGALVPVALRVLSWPASAAVPLDPTVVEAGKKLFVHEWKVNDPLAGGDGLGPVFNAASCVACHQQGGLGGSGGLRHNVTVFTVRPEKDDPRSREGVVHARAVSTGFQERLPNVHPGLPDTAPTLDFVLSIPLRRQNCDPSFSAPVNIHLSHRNTPAMFGAGLIDQIPERAIIAQERLQRLRFGLAPSDSENLPVGRALRLADGRVGKFGWKGQSASLLDFVQAACANELGLGNPGQAQPKPLTKPEYRPRGLDLTAEQCRQMAIFLASLPRPVERPPANLARSHADGGKQIFLKIGCADCHVPSLGGVEGLYSDLLLHRMGKELTGGGSYFEPRIDLPNFSPGEGPLPDEWRTPPLWGVADSAPYMHDGRAATLEEAIQMHHGQADRSARRFQQLPQTEQQQLLAFLKSLRAP